MSESLEWRNRTETLSRIEAAIRARGRAVIGLTGGIGSGKSSVARVLGSEGFEVLDADRLSRELSQPDGRAFAPIVALMGSEDRSVWREKSFRDPELRRKLEAILHPMIREESARRIASARGAVVFYEAALLMEAGRAGDFDALIAVICDPELQQSRVQNRDGHPAEQVRAMLAAQTTNESRKRSADIVITNDGPVADLEAAARSLAGSLRKLTPA